MLYPTMLSSGKPLGYLTSMISFENLLSQKHLAFYQTMYISQTFCCFYKQLAPLVLENHLFIQQISFTLTKGGSTCCACTSSQQHANHADARCQILIDQPHQTKKPTATAYQRQMMLYRPTGEWSYVVCGYQTTCLSTCQSITQCSIKIFGKCSQLTPYTFSLFAQS